jgi:pimeloyl-ACP methyl ester carboxylesterase
LRLDLGGLGDSISPDPDRENDAYPATAFRDIDSTLKYLVGQLGAERVVLMGLCSGAYAAFQSAARLRDPVLVECVAINPLTFYWQEGMSLDHSPAHRLQELHDAATAVFKPEKWLKLLSGRSKIGITGVLRRFLDRWRRRGAAEPEEALRDPETADFPLAHPFPEDLPGDLERIVRANRHLGCFFSRSDPGYRLLVHHARRKVSELCRSGRMSVHFIEQADHTFSRRPLRRALGEAIAEHLYRRYPAPGAI